MDLLLPRQGLATLRYQPSEEFMTLFCQRMEDQLDELSWLDVPNVSFAGLSP